MPVVSSERQAKPLVDSTAVAPEIERDRNLVSRYLEGDEDAYSELFGLYGKRINNLLLRITGNADDAADATQEAFCNFLARVREMDIDKVNVQAYLYKSARNAATNKLRLRKRIEPTDEMPEPEPHVELELDPERSTLQGDASRAIAIANARLPERQRRVLAMRELEDMSYGKIASVLDVNVNSVAQLILRARIKLRDELRQQSLARPVEGASCKRATLLMSLKLEGHIKGPDRKWLDGHIDSCDDCRVNYASIEEAGISYRGLLPALLAITKIAARKLAILKKWNLGRWATKLNLVLCASCTTGIFAVAIVSDSGDGIYRPSGSSATQAGNFQAGKARGITKGTKSRKAKKVSSKKSDKRDSAGQPISGGSSDNSPAAGGGSGEPKSSGRSPISGDNEKVGGGKGGASNPDLDAPPPSSPPSGGGGDPSSGGGGDTVGGGDSGGGGKDDGGGGIGVPQQTTMLPTP